MKKKVNVFGKSVPVLAIFVLGLAVVSAALLGYYGVITGSVIVGQGLFLDDKAWDDTTITYSASLTSLEEETVSSGLHDLANKADVIAKVKLMTTCDEAGTGDGCNDVTITPVFELSIPSETAPNLVQDRVVVEANGIAVDEISTLNFKYKLTETTTGYSPYFVLVFGTNDDGVGDTWAVSLQDTETANVWHTHGNGLSYHNVGTCTQSSLCDLAGLKSQLSGTAKLLQVKAMIGYWGDMTATTVLVKNLEVNGVDLVDNGLIIKQYDGSDPDDSENGDVIVDFSIETYFPQMMIPDTYTITTKVLPA